MSVRIAALIDQYNARLADVARQQGEIRRLWHAADETGVIERLRSQRRFVPGYDLRHARGWPTVFGKRAAVSVGVAPFGDWF
jgi:hypothetical protein